MIPASLWKYLAGNLCPNPHIILAIADVLEVDPYYVLNLLGYLPTGACSHILEHYEITEAKKRLQEKMNHLTKILTDLN